MLAVCVWGILLLLHSADCGRFDVIVPSPQITAVAGETVILPCYVKSRISAVDFTVKWLKISGDQGIVHLYKDGRDINENQSPSFKERTALFKEELKTGITSLKLLWVRGTDEGTFQCSVRSPAMNWEDHSNIKVNVKAVGSQPVVSIEGHRGAGMGLVCETQGWYPEPEMVWLDSEGVPLSAGPPETTRDSEGLYTLNLRVTVQKTDRNLFTCTVKHKYMEGEMVAEFHVPDELFYQDHTWKETLIWVLGVSAVTLAVLVICVLVKWCHKESNLIGDMDYEAVRQHAVDVTLDSDTANPHLLLSDDERQVTCGDNKQDLLDTSEVSRRRFDEIRCVLGRPGFSSGKFYYEVQVKDKTGWSLGVAKESCNRKGYITQSPQDGYWTIQLKEGKYEALTDHRVPHHLSLSLKPQKVGVFVDYKEGTVSFYNVEARCQIYSFTSCSFTERLHPFFRPGRPGVVAENSAPLVICPHNLYISDYEAIRQHAVDVTLDSDTANPYLFLSADRKQVTCGDKKQDLPDTPERFDEIRCVLGRPGFSSGRFYYEVQVKDKTGWSLGVAENPCRRKRYVALRSIFGYWTITLREGKYEALTDHRVPLHLSLKPQKVGVFVDYEEATVSFYNVEARCQIYSFTGCSFTGRLHPFFSLGSRVDLEVNAAPLVICPVEGVVPVSPSLVSQSRPEAPQEVQAGSNTAVQVESESQTYESDSAFQSLLDQGHQSESSEETIESVSLLGQSASYKV